jgi:hypothetical protein
MTDGRQTVNITNNLWTAALLALIALLLHGCGSATTPRPEAERAAISQYKGWTIAVTPARIDTNQWRARVRVWPPEVRPGLHPGINLSASEPAADRDRAEKAGIAAARRYIDASQPMHQDQR